jgi:CRISPR-associated protein Csm1
MQERTFKAALAGLLHDIGKIEQRARPDPWKPPEGHEDSGQPVHAAWTAYFAEQYVPSPYKATVLHSAYHHQPQRSPAENPGLSELVALADKLSAGERADPPDKNAIPPQQMISIFDHLDTGGKAAPGPTHYLPLKPLKLGKEHIFPTEPMNKQSSREAYERLVEQLRAAARNPIDQAEVYLENLLVAMQRLTWCVPSAYYHSLPDVSLFDHSRMTAALAVCLAERSPDEIPNYLALVQADFAKKLDEAGKIELKKPAALLIGGDISGIQSFLYTISSKNAARTLRGRSFYLQLLTEAVLRYLLRELDLPYTNVIYTGGGHFFILAPLSAADRLSQIKRKVSEIFLQQHGPQLYLALGCAEVPFEGFRLGNFPEYWDAMHTDLGRAKQQRYTELGEDIYSRVFELPEFGGNPDDTCSVCGDDARRVKDIRDEEGESIKICMLCSSFAEEIGAQLPKAQFLALGFGEPKPGTKGSVRDALAAFGVEYAFINSPTDPVQLHNAEYVVIWALGDVPEDQWPSTDGKPAVQALRYTVNQAPMVRNQAEAKEINARLTETDRREQPAIPGEAKTFTHLQALAGGFHRLGVLRMDVDNLGEIFSFGFLANSEENRASLARLSTLSFQISLFFEGWVKHLAEVASDNIYAVYSGGDDLFLIAPWNEVPALALQIRQDFKQFTGDHPGLTLSGGMAFIHGKYPVYQAAEDAAEALQWAKDHPDNTKDAFSFLNIAWRWETFEQIRVKKERLVALLEGGETEPGGPRSPIQILRQLAAAEAEAARIKGRPVWGPWIWRGAYRLVRLADQYEKSNPALAQAIRQLHSELGDDYAEINQWGAAARWAQLETRKSQQPETQ